MSGKGERDEHLTDNEEETNGYQPPPQKSIKDILAADEQDESLRKYKQTLFGSDNPASIIIDPNNQRNVLVRKLALVVEGRPDMELDLTSDLSKLKEKVFIVKEGISYRIRIDFHIQREIVTGLKYIQKTYRKGIQVDKMSHMVGSYAPKHEVHSYTTPPEEAPSGLLTRGNYSVTSLFTDDDKNEHLKWEWGFDIKKDWEK